MAGWAQLLNSNPSQFSHEVCDSSWFAVLSEINFALFSFTVKDWISFGYGIGSRLYLFLWSIKNSGEYFDKLMIFVYASIVHLCF